MPEGPVFRQPTLPALSSDLSSALYDLFAIEDDEPSDIPGKPTPEIPPCSLSAAQAPTVDAVDVEEEEPEPQSSYSPAPSRPGSPMSIDDDGAAHDSPLQDVAEKDAEDLSHLCKLHLQDHMSHTVRRIWPDIPSDEDPHQPGLHYPSTDPWPTAKFTAVKEAWSKPPDGSGLASFPLPSGRPTPVQTLPATIPDRYAFSSPSTRVSLCEPSDLGLVYRR